MHHAVVLGRRKHGWATALHWEYFITPCLQLEEPLGAQGYYYRHDSSWDHSWNNSPFPVPALVASQTNPGKNRGNPPLILSPRRDEFEYSLLLFSAQYYNYFWLLPPRGKQLCGSCYSKKCCISLNQLAPCISFCRTFGVMREKTIFFLSNINF